MCQQLRFSKESLAAETTSVSELCKLCQKIGRNLQLLGYDSAPDVCFLTCCSNSNLFAKGVTSHKSHWS